MGYGPRPTGVTILAVLAALLAVVFLIALFGSVLLLVLSNNTDLLNQLTTRGAPQWIIDNFRTIFAVLAIVFLVFMLDAAFLAWGFLKGSRWAWALGVTFMIVDLIATVVQAVALPGTDTVVGLAIRLVIPLLILYYLTLGRVKSFFFGPSQTPQMTPPPPGGQV